MEFLDGNDVHYVHTRHTNGYRAREVALALLEHVPPYRQAKTVIVCADMSYGIALLPADCTLDPQELAEHLGVSRVRLATESEAEMLVPDAEFGAMPPFGSLFDLPVYMDQRLAPEKYIVFSAGTHGDALHMRLTHYLRLANPLILRFSHREARVA